MELRSAAGRALAGISREAEAAGRLERWRLRILGAVGRGWCVVREGEGAEGLRRGEEGEPVREFEGVLREIVGVVRGSEEGKVSSLVGMRGVRGSSSAY